MVLGEKVYHCQQALLNNSILKQAGTREMIPAPAHSLLSQKKRSSLLLNCSVSDLGCGTTHHDNAGAEGPPKLTEKTRAQLTLEKKDEKNVKRKITSTVI